MDIRAVTISGRTIIEGLPGVPLLPSADRITDLVAACFEHHSQALMLYAENLTPRFFDLSSGDAGEILQKLRNYRIKLAVVAPTADVHRSTRFDDMLIEESRTGYFRVFDDKDAAEVWLLGR